MDCKTKIKELREMTGMNRKEFCKFFNIPYRTVTNGNWITAMHRNMCCGCWSIISATKD